MPEDVRAKLLNTPDALSGCLTKEISLYKKNWLLLCLCNPANAIITKHLTITDRNMCLVS